MVWPTLEGFSKSKGAGLVWLRRLPLLLRTLAIVCLAVAMARPQTVGGRTRIAGRGVAIIVALDHSSSMKTADFPVEDDGQIPRLDAAKRTLARFIAGRPDDLIGLVTFANYPDLECPPTLDHVFLLEAVRRVKPASPGDDGTNLGDAIALGLEALESPRTTRPIKKVLILLTDGRNQPAVPRPLDPREAAKLAGDLGITLHTIAVGLAGGNVRQPEAVTGLALVRQVEGPDLAGLAELSRLGGGRAFVATDTHALEEVFRTIDALEKSPIRGTIQTRYQERYGPWVLAAIILLALDRLLSARWLRRLP
jgi:Ca-activated chloride channel family protein